MRKSRGCRFKSDRYPLLGVVAQLAETTTTKDVDELIGSNVDSIPLMYPLSYTYYSVERTIPLFVTTKDTMGILGISSGHF